MYVLYTSSMLSGLFLASMSIDRLLAVKYPMDAQRLCTASRARKTVLALTGFISAANIHLFFAINYIKDKELGRFVNSNA